MSTEGFPGVEPGQIVLLVLDFSFTRYYVARVVRAGDQVESVLVRYPGRDGWTERSLPWLDYDRLFLAELGRAPNCPHCDQPPTHCRAVTWDRYIAECWPCGLAWAFVLTM